jgi:hypothetical protein
MRRVSVWLLRISVVLGARIAAACPLCAENLSNDVYQKNPTALGRGFFWSIIFMMALPFVTVGFVALRILIARRRRPAAGSEADGSESNTTGVAAARASFETPA